MDLTKASNLLLAVGMQFRVDSFRSIAAGGVLIAISFLPGTSGRTLAQTAHFKSDAARPPSSPSSTSPQSSQVDFTDWSPIRIKAYGEALGANFPEPMVTVTVVRLHLQAPLFEGVDNMTLDRGVGRIPGTSLPGNDGNLAIAGHRDGFFRPLKDIRKGDVIEIKTLESRDTYIVEHTTVVDPGDVDVLKPRSRPALTLVTCYPFYFLGHAPQRFIVEAYRTRKFSQVQSKRVPTGSLDTGKR